MSIRTVAVVALIFGGLMIVGDWVFEGSNPHTAKPLIQGAAFYISCLLVWQMEFRSLPTRRVGFVAYAALMAAVVATIAVVRIALALG